MGFGGFKSAVKKWFDDVGMEGGTPGKDDGKPNKTTAKTAKFIADEYEKAIKKMKTPNGHGPLSYNKSALEKAFKGAFDMLDADKTGALKPAAGAMMGAGFVGFWAGAMMKPSPPSPGQSVGIANPVVSPGAPIPVSIGGPSEDTGGLASAIASAADKHSKTLAGIHNGLSVPTPATPPLPVPWATIS